MVSIVFWNSLRIERISSLLIAPALYIAFTICLISTHIVSTSLPSESSIICVNVVSSTPIDFPISSTETLASCSSLTCICSAIRLLNALSVTEDIWLLIISAVKSVSSKSVLFLEPLTLNS